MYGEREIGEMWCPLLEIDVNCALLVMRERVAPVA